eukprot:SAG31_NODE_19822_length_590_cov_6.747454_1_plen_35_part_10
MANATATGALHVSFRNLQCDLLVLGSHQPMAEAQD